MSIEETHADVAREIAAGVRCRAQAMLHGVKVSYHLGRLGGLAFTHLPLSERQADPTNLTGEMIDAWVRGQADVSPGTFSREQMLFRAELHRFGRIPGRQGDRKPELAASIETFAREHAGELAGQPAVLAMHG